MESLDLDQSMNHDSPQPGTIQISRPVFTNEHFNKIYPPKKPEQLTGKDVKKWLPRSVCSFGAAKSLLYYILPSLKWIPKYQIRKYLVHDVIAGLTIGVVNIPQGMAFALLASLAPVYGLYVSFFPVLIYFLMGTSRHISIGTFAVVSIMCSNSVQGILDTIQVPTDVPKNESLMRTGVTQNYSMSTPVPTSQYLEAEKIKIHTALCLLVGIFQMLMSVCRLGFVTVYLSESLIRAFTCGAACHVITSQIKYIFGLGDLPMHNGFFAIIYNWLDIFKHLADTNAAEFIIAITALMVLVVVKIISVMWKDKIKFPIPVEFIIVIIGTVLSYFCKFADKYNIDCVGHIPEGFPKPEVPAMKYFGQLIGDAFAISIVGFAASVSLGTIFATKHGYEINSNQELLAYGAANVVSSFFSCFVSAASLARSVLQDGVGAKTQVTSVVSCALVLIVVLWLGPLLEPLPKVILAVIIIFALKDMIVQITDLRYLWKQSKYDWMIWLVTLFAVVLLGVDIGLFVGIGFAFITVVIRTQLTQFTLSGNISGTEIYKNVDVYSSADNLSNIKVFCMQSSLYFANVNKFRDTLYTMVGVNPSHILANCQAEESSRNDLRKSKVPKKTGSNGNTETDKGTSNADYQTIGVNESAESQVNLQLEAIVIDCSAFNFIDIMAAKMLLAMVENYDKIGIKVVLAECKDSVQQMLRNGGFFDKMRQDCIYLTVHDAVTALTDNANVMHGGSELQQV